MNIKDVFLALFVVLVWGSYFIATKIALISFPSLLFAGLRFFILFAITSAYIFKDRLPLKDIFYFSGLILLNMLAINQAIHLCSNLAPIILIDELVVPMSVLLGAIFFKEKLHLNDAIGMFIAFIGLVIVIHMRSEEHVCAAAIILTIIATISFALYNLFAKKLSAFNLMTVNSFSSLLIFPIFLILSFYQEKWPAFEAIQLQSILALVYIVIFGLAAVLIWMYLLNKYPMNKVTPFILLVPVFGCIITSIILNENIEVSTLGGGALIIIGLAIIEWKRSYDKKKS